VLFDVNPDIRFQDAINLFSMQLITSTLAARKRMKDVELMRMRYAIESVVLALGAMGNSKNNKVKSGWHHPESCVTQITINVHYGRVIEANPILYDFGLYFLVPGTNLEAGLRSLKNDDGVRNCRQYALRNIGEIDIYMVHFEFSEHITADSDLSESEEDDYDVRTQKTAPKTKKKPTKMFDDNFLARFFIGIERENYIEKEVGPDDEFNVEDHDKLGDHWPIHNPNTKWKFMRPVLGESLRE
ncbi:hypothetical protein Tco_0927203, partial [Tanacetum coccineum]